MCNNKNKSNEQELLIKQQNNEILKLMKKPPNNITINANTNTENNNLDCCYSFCCNLSIYTIRQIYWRTFHSNRKTA